MLHHHRQKADNDFGAWPNEDLAFASLLSIVDALESICQDVHAHHDGCSGNTRPVMVNIDKTQSFHCNLSLPSTHPRRHRS
jgi:hypothetical protein